MLKEGQETTKNDLAMEVKIGGDAAKSGNNTNLLVIIHMRLSQKNLLLDFNNWTQFKKGNISKIRKKSVCDYWVMYIMLHVPSFYYGHTSVKILILWCMGFITW